MDEGMVLELDGQRFFGADAINRLALLSTPSGWFNRANSTVFRHPMLARALYPLMRAGRNLVLFSLGRQRLHQNHRDELSAFAVFSHAFGVFGFIDFLYHLYRQHPSPAIWATGALGAYLAVRPRSPRVFGALVLTMLANAIAQMPTYSNHAIVLNFTLLAMAAAALYTWIRGRNWSCFMRSFAPVGRCLLVVMYFFGVFHKLNSDFLDPSISCATSLWDSMPDWMASWNLQWFRQLAIYGTLVGESAILLGLLAHRTRHLGIISGMAFHSMLALSGYGFYPAFSTLTISLHLLFLSPGAASRIVCSPSWTALQARMRGRIGLIGVAAWMALLLFLSVTVSSTYVGAIWLPWSAWLMYTIGSSGRERTGETLIGPPILSRTWMLNLISVAFFLNGAAPYLGIKNAQSINMFSNLIHEGGYSNHLIMAKVPRAFGYLDDLVQVTNSPDSTQPGSNGPVEYQAYYSLLDYLERHPGARVSFVRNGIAYRDQSATSLAADIHKELHPRWIRGWLHFKRITLPGPRTCDAG